MPIKKIFKKQKKKLIVFFSQARHGTCGYGTSGRDTCIGRGLS